MSSNKKVLDIKVARNSKCFYNSFIKIAKKNQAYHGYIHWPLAAMPRGFLVIYESLVEYLTPITPA